MKVSNFGTMINYIRNVLLTQPTEDVEGDDLKIEIFDNEISFYINDLYDGPIITYNTLMENKFEVTFRHCEDGVKTGEAVVRNVEMLKAAADIVALILDNEEMLKEFLNREEM